jgi:hypothetical protein
VEHKTGVFFEPCLYIGVIVGPIVIEDHMDIEAVGYFTVNRAEELQKLGVPVPGIARPDDFPFQDIKGCKKTRGAVSLIVMSHYSAAPFLHGEPGLCPI